jgi:hypothetical protein
MNITQMKKIVLSYIDEYSVDGVLTPDGDNQDYLLRMKVFANDAQMEISNLIGIDASQTSTLSNYVPENGLYKISLPSDFRRFKGLTLNGDDVYGFTIENGKVLIPTGYEGSIELFYFKNPTQLTSETPDTYEFEVDIYTHSLIPLYVGGMVIAGENLTLSDRLLNMYYGRLGGLRKETRDIVSEITVI